MTHDNIYNQYPWLKMHAGEIADYIPPEYYNKILKEYIFDGKSDLELFADYLDEKVAKQDNHNVLELGFGSGRATDVLIKSEIQFDLLDLVDLSDHMITFSKNKYEDMDKIHFIRSDNVDYIGSTNRQYDFCYSLWSFSHSVHQHLIADKERWEYIYRNIVNFLEKNLTSGAKFYLVHFDSKSEEQRILFKQWRKVFPIFEDLNKQSPSKLIMDRVFKESTKRGIGKSIVTHHIGGPIEYTSIEEALEIFMNFHMETYFNQSDIRDKVIQELKGDLERYKKDGGIYIKPGCFIYQFERY